MSPATPGTDDGDPLDFTCPRCATGARERFYGPCAACRQALAATQGGAGSGADTAGAGRFEPAMHVVPNHVATKE